MANTLRSSINADLAGIRGDLGRIHADMAEDDEVNVWEIIKRLDQIRKDVKDVQDALSDISVRALRDVLDKPRT